ncbi:MAG: hypothetical protein JWN56_570 [Sphingobacteriales bacterium]|nr:hypothetical protein [Sphingobacteriales bacterium]
MKKIRYSIVAVCLCLAGSMQFLYAQSIIEGKIVDEKDNSLQYVNILLLRSPDSALVKGTTSNAEGAYSFANISKGKYLLSYSFIGMEKKFSSIVDIAAEKHSKNLGILKFKSNNKVLDQVVISAKKPLFEQKIDRMVINVKSSITNAGGSALDVLEKSPGVLVNKQANSLSINGKNGVVVMINGKISYMPMDALVQMLAGISAGNIDKIELITTPPAKYDAGGNAGYINIVLSNSPDAGLNGSYFITGGYSRREAPAAGANFNYRSGKVNLYGNYSFNWDHQIQLFNNLRQSTITGNMISNSSRSDRDGKSAVNNLRLGLDYQIDSSNVIGGLLSGYNSRWSMLANNNAFVQKNNTVDTIINTIDNEINHWQNMMANLNFQHTFKPDNVLYLDANYIYYKDNNPNDYINSFYSPAAKLVNQQQLKSGKITPIHFNVFSADYSTKIGKKLSVETGAKLSLSKFNNDVSVQHLQQNTWVTDKSLSANYALAENINAVYTSITANLTSKTTLKAGLRYEYTTSNLGTPEKANIVDRKYGELFPTFYLSQKLNEKNSINVSYSRRITRPTFNDLAPFTIFFDPKTYFTGNPALQPAIANSAQASFVHKNLIFSLSFTHEDNTIQGFQNTVDTLKDVQLMSAYNFDKTQYVTSSFSLPFTINKWWNMQNNLIGNILQISTTYNNAPVHLKTVDFNLNTTQRFTLPRSMSMELTGYYYSASYYGTQKYNPIYQLDFGIQKKFSNKKDILRLAVTDITNSGSKYNYIDKMPNKGVHINGDYTFAATAVKLTYTHNFGNNLLKEKRERATGAEDELNRVKK